MHGLTIYGPTLQAADPSHHTYVARLDGPSMRGSGTTDGTQSAGMNLRSSRGVQTLEPFSTARRLVLSKSRGEPSAFPITAHIGGKIIVGAKGVGASDGTPCLLRSDQQTARTGPWFGSF